MSDERSLRFLGLTKTQFGVVVLGLLALLVVSSVLLLIRVNSLANSNTKALCATRNFYEAQITSTNEFLEKNRGEEPIEGISRAQLIQSRDRQQGLVNSLRYVKCPEMPAPAVGLSP